MKIIFGILTFWLISIQISFSQNVGISDVAGQSVSSSAVLDVQSATKGMLVPRMDSTSRKAIASPAEGLLIYDTSTKSFWFYGTLDNRTTGSWREIQNGGISDKNSITIKEQGGVVLNNGATTWNDLVVTPFSTYRGTGAPIIGTMLGSVDAVTFENGITEQVYFSVQMPHNWKEGTTIYPHIHWSPQSTGTGTVIWGLEYSWVNYNSTTPETFPSTTTITGTTTIASASSDKHLITSLSSMTDATKKISSIIICRLYRSGGTDSFSGNVALLSFDFHYEIDGLGSDQPYVK